MVKPQCTACVAGILLSAAQLLRGADACLPDGTFNAGLAEDAYVARLAMQPDGRMLIGGAFTIYGAPNRVNIARLQHNGSLDATFNAGTAADIGPVVAIVTQPDGRILIGGSFYSSTGSAPQYLARLNANGTVDPGFNSHFSIDGPINALALQPDGKIIIAGNFVVVEGIVRRSIARLNANGTIDPGFDACVAGSPDGANALVILDDGRIIMGGNFTFSTGVARNGIARLNSNGDVDATFAREPGVNFGATVYAVAVRPDGSILIGGNFSSYHNVTRSGVAQIFPDFGGIVDQNYDPGAGINDGASVLALALEASGNLIVGGTFSSFNNQTRYGLARLGLDGHLAPGCDAGGGDAPRVSSLAMTADGKVVVGGLFSGFGGGEQSALVRLQGDVVPFSMGPPSRVSNGRFQLSIHGQPQVRYSIESSSNLVDWLSFTNFVCTSDSMSIVDPSTNSRPARFYRGVIVP
ncbi:MAG: hypothetical protein QOF48_3769 [Verrucomicrobiota bacterium]|jgi:uncharacterized delta-60 repeat protein